MFGIFPNLAIKIVIKRKVARRHIKKGRNAYKTNECAPVKETHKLTSISWFFIRNVSTEYTDMSNKEFEKMTSDRIVVRAIEPKDEDAWHKLWKEYQGFQKTDMPLEVATTNFARFLDPTVKLWGALAFDTETGNAIGFAHYLSHLTSWHVEEVIYMNDLYVTEHARIKGVGRKLIEFVYKRADELGTPAVYWVTDHYNHRAQLLYTKVAYKTDKVLYKRTGY